MLHPERRLRRTVEVGALFRRQFRALCDLHGIPYVEHKGWLSSTFVVTVTTAQSQALDRIEIVEP
jgi:hypothetical protein